MRALQLASAPAQDLRAKSTTPFGGLRRVGIPIEFTTPFKGLKHVRISILLLKAPYHLVNLPMVSPALGSIL